MRADAADSRTKPHVHCAHEATIESSKDPLPTDQKSEVLRTDQESEKLEASMIYEYKTKAFVSTPYDAPSPDDPRFRMDVNARRTRVLLVSCDPGLGLGGVVAGVEKSVSAVGELPCVAYLRADLFLRLRGGCLASSS